MDPTEVPTKGNLMRARNSLALARQGYELMDRKRNILIRELTALIDQAREIQDRIDSAYRKAYAALETANVEMGISAVEDISHVIPLEDTVEVLTRSIMGTEIPLVRYTRREPTEPEYALYRTRDALDRARKAFDEVKDLTIRLSGVEISAHRLASDIQRTRKRANALQNITLPRYEELIRSISSALEEKEREEFTRLKVIKKRQASEV